MQQLTFDLADEPELTKENFIISYCNLEAYTMVANSVDWPDNRLLIIGPEGGGKSHLARIFTNNNMECFINHDLKMINLDLMMWVVEDIEQINCEKQLFHIINIAQEHSIKLLLTASYLPRYQLKDLQSRVNSTSKIIIKRPDDSLLRALLIKHFTDRQLTVPSSVMEYIFTRTERSFKYIKQLVKNIDKISLVKRREITIPLVKEILENNMPENLADES